ncbi:DeoR/GlpR family DNA-binding transcription regulator [Prosthecomicrobium pneumaticum]|uniref:DeoR family ulaG and ulaABCDEF operon transcriptional repressor n=1 Tax=Prosthecomicrobium pneumaticum TaxID=81895 RepID=A0A7W9FLB9_9HYPH|nr:DeoR/GlpR family DNA-binding transcription regulator [Prosthecomicrobium pneumaticum]MBB5752772.1 DeoR family ulaG and ulaABCDEF operon transcriptional repressor [Prosthecomicrobium pneumaticum]
MHEIERHRIILGEIARRPVATIGRLVELTGASEATIRRDINTLDIEGRIRKVRGGAGALTRPQERLDPLATPAFEATRFVHLAAKRAIARRAAELVADGEPVIVNGGTTTYCLGPFFADRSLDVLTNSLDLALYLIANSACRVVLPGGDVHRKQRMIVSPYESDTAIEHFYATKFLLGAHAIRPQGLIEGDPTLIKAEQKMLKQADEVIALVDGSKFEPRGSLILCPLAELDRVITDRSAPADAIAMLEDAGVTVDVVDAEERADERSEQRLAATG